MLWIDFETRSRCDLKSHGVYNYVLDASTDVLCMSYAFDDDEVVTWTPDQPFPFPDYKGQIRAHNAAFERLVLWHVLEIPFKLEQFYCTATQARANCLPGSLEDIGRAIGATMKKDHRGNQLIRLLSIPRADGTFNDDPTLMAEMVAYCEQDVRAMRAVSKAMRDLDDDELRDYHINERINDRGVLVDKPLCEAAVRYASAELEEIQQIVSEVTKGAITSVRSPKMRDWVWDRVGPEARKLMMVEDKTIADKIKKTEKIYVSMVSRDEYPDSTLTTKVAVLEQDRFKVSIDKSVRANLLAMNNPDEVPPDVEEVIQCADDLWASSVAKFTRAAALSDEEDHRVRGAFVFAGGSATGRAASYGLQLQNFPRKCAKEPDEVRQAMVRGHAIVPKYGKRATDVLKSMLRPMIIPAKGKSLIVYDWSSIEARVLPWLSGDGETTLQIFREGRDIYKSTAARMFNIDEKDVTSEQRQQGKIAVLACGFASGVGAFDAMARVYGVYLSETEAKRMVDLWRRANPWAQPFWRSLDDASRRALRNKNHLFHAGRITYLYDGQHLWYVLPSGRVLCYPFARFDDEGNITYVKASWKPAQDAKEWPRARLWAGILAENVTQATAHDKLRLALRNLDAAGFNVVAHIHDEIIVEHDTNDAEKAAQAVRKIMVTPPAWADDFPLAAEGDIMLRYHK